MQTYQDSEDFDTMISLATQYVYKFGSEEDQRLIEEISNYWDKKQQLSSKQKKQLKRIYNKTF